MAIMDGLKRMFTGVFGLGQQQQAQPPDMTDDPEDGQMQQQPRQQPTATTAPPLGDEGKKLWKSRIARAQEQHEPYWKIADLIRREYLGAQDPTREFTGGADATPVNLISSFINTTMPQLLPANPWPVVSAKKPGQQYADGARLLEARQRQVFDRPATFKHLRRALFDAECMSGFVLTGWQPTTSAAAVAPVKQTEGQSNEPVRELTEDPSTLTPDEPFVRHIPYRDIIIDPDAKSIDDVEWIGYRTRKKLADVKAKEGTLYHNTAELKGWGGRGEHDNQDDAEDGTSRDKRDELVELFTIFTYGRKKGELRVLVLAGSQKTEIRNVYVKLGVQGFPIRMLSFYDVGRLWPAASVQFWIDLHTSFNEFVIEATERASEAKNLTIVPDEDTRDKIANARGNQIIVARDSSLVKQIQQGGNHPETWAALQAFERLVEKISAITDAQRGVGSEPGQTATAASIVQQAATGRMSDMANCVNRFLREVASDMGGMLLAHQWQEVPVKLDLGGGEEQWGMFSNHNLPPDGIAAFDFDFDVSEMARTTQAVKQKRAQDRLALFSDPNFRAGIAQEGYRIKLVEATKDMLEASGERDIPRYIEKLPTPQELAQQQQQKAMGENEEMLQTGQPAMIDPAGDDHQIHAAVHRQSADQSDAIAEHLAEHYGFMQGGMGAQGPVGQQAGNPQGGQPMPAPAMHEGPARAMPASMAPQNEAALMATAERS